MGTVQNLRGGHFDPAAAQAVAKALGLNARALLEIRERKWAPAELQAFAGLAQFNSAFGEMTVNAYLVWDVETKEAAAFDTGGDAAELLETLRREGLTLKYLLLTHTHGDHIFDLDRVREQTGAPAYVSSREPLEGAESIEPGQTFAVGKLRIGTRLTWGHSPGGLTYVVEGLKRPVAVVGDALFAGSMGGGSVSFADALRTNRAEIFTLPEETIICPGHGPMTTVGEEKAHNPFFAEER